MTAQNAFLEAILANPDDDVSRLVYADWLDDHGDPARAEFIRVQCERTRLPDYEPRRVALRRREQALLLAHQQTWLQEVQTWARRKVVFHRGFVEEVRWCTVSEFLKGAEGLLRRVPLRAATLRCTIPAQLEALARSAVLGCLSRLDLENCPLPVPTLRVLMASPHLARLKRLSLRLGWQDAGAAVAEALACSPQLAGLEHLELRGSGHIGNAGAIALADSPYLKNLTSLRLNNNDLDNAGVLALVQSPHLTGLTELSLTVQRVDEVGVAALAALLPRLRLKCLDLSGLGKIGDAGARALATAPGLAGLTVLRLRRCGIGDAGLRALAESPYLTELRYLDLGANSFGDEGALALASSPVLGKLSLLGLAGIRLSAAAVEALGGSPRLPGLAFLLVTGGDLDHGSVIGAAPWGALKKRFGERLLCCFEAMMARTGKLAVQESTLTLDYLPDVLM